MSNTNQSKEEGSFSGGVPLDDEQIAMQQVTQARMSLQSAIEAFEAAGYGSHVTNPLRDALRFVEFSISEVTS